MWPEVVVAKLDAHVRQMREGISKLHEAESLHRVT